MDGPIVKVWLQRPRCFLLHCLLTHSLAHQEKEETTWYRYYHRHKIAQRARAVAQNTKKTASMGALREVLNSIRYKFALKSSLLFKLMDNTF